jgi:hypothetical protein
MSDTVVVVRDLPYLQDGKLHYAEQDVRETNIDIPAFESLWRASVARLGAQDCPPAGVGARSVVVVRNVATKAEAKCTPTTGPWSAVIDSLKEATASAWAAGPNGAAAPSWPFNGDYWRDDAGQSTATRPCPDAAIESREHRWTLAGSWRWHAR